MVDPKERPNEHRNRNRKDEDQCAYERSEESPVFPGVAARMSEVALHDLVVAAVWFEGDIKGVAQDRNRTDQHSDAEIHGHASEGDIWHAAGPCGDWDDERQDAGDDVAKPGYEANDSIDSKAKAREWNGEGFIQKNFEAAQGLVVEEPCSFRPAVRRKHGSL